MVAALAATAILETAELPPLGAHMSIAGGYYKAVTLAHAAGCDCVQVFTKNNNQWRAKPLTDDDAARFQDALAQTGVRYDLRPKTRRAERARGTIGP